MKTGRLLLIAALAGSAAPAAAAVTVIGNSSARMCYEAAESKGANNIAALDRCNEALSDEGLSVYDQTATYVNRGILKLRLERVDDAISDFDSAIARDPDQAEAYINKGIAMLRRDNGWSDALALFDTGIQKRTRRPAIAYFGRAVANEMGGRIKEAYLDYRQASLIEPKWRQPKAELSRFTVRQP
jgi:tetratricopeptide (TPR) repeat protein